MFITIDLQICKIQNAKHEYTEKSPTCIVSLKGAGKQEIVHSERRMTSFLLHLRSGALLFHGQGMVQTATKRLTVPRTGIRYISSTGF